MAKDNKAKGKSKRELLERPKRHLYFEYIKNKKVKCEKPVKKSKPTAPKSNTSS